MEVLDELFVQLLTRPYRKNENVHEDGNYTPDRDRVQPINRGPQWIAHSVPGGDDQTVCE